MSTSTEKRLGNLFGATGGSFAGMVYDKSRLCPSLTTMGGGGRQPHIIEVKYESNIVCIAQRGRNPEYPTSRTLGLPTEQRYEVCNKKNIANAITTVAKDCMALEIKRRF